MAHALDLALDVMEFTKNGFEWSYEGPSRANGAGNCWSTSRRQRVAMAAAEPFMRAVVANFGNEWR